MTAARGEESAILLILKPPFSSASVSFSLCCGNTQRITSAKLALLKPPQAAALILLACTRHCGPGLVAGACRKRSPVSGWVSAGLSDGLVKPVLVVSTEVWGTLE